MQPTNQSFPYYIPTEAEVTKINNIFDYHPVQPGQEDRYKEIRKHYKELALFIEQNCPPSRELSLEITNLQLSMNLANGAIAINELPETPV